MASNVRDDATTRCVEADLIVDNSALDAMRIDEILHISSIATRLRRQKRGMKKQGAAENCKSIGRLRILADRVDADAARFVRVTDNNIDRLERLTKRLDDDDDAIKLLTQERTHEELPERMSASH
jgi:hypothetical protein